jgi:uncharacterized membrane protein
MSRSQDTWTDERVEQIMGNLLRAGVLLAAVVVLAGGLGYLAHHGADDAREYRAFHGEPQELRSLRGIVEDALSGDSRGIIQLGLLLLIATPIARVIFAAVAFALQRDRIYFLITVVVLVVLLYSLVGGSLE